MLLHGLVPWPTRTDHAGGGNRFGHLPKTGVNPIFGNSVISASLLMPLPSKIVFSENLR